MSKEQDFQKLLIKQNQSEKDKLWAKIDNQQDEEVIELGEVLGKKRKVSKNYVIIISSLICLLAVISIILVCTLTIKKEPEIRYCLSEDYYFEETEISIEQYAKDNGKDILFFDWYAESEDYSDIQYKLNGVGEVICLREELLDKNNVYVAEYVRDINTQIDFLELFHTNCRKSVMINSYQVYWSGNTYSGQKAYFVCNNYVYYLSIEGKADEGYILGLAEDLIK